MQSISSTFSLSLFAALTVSFCFDSVHKQVKHEGLLLPTNGAGWSAGWAVRGRRGHGPDGPVGHSGNA